MPNIPITAIIVEEWFNGLYTATMLLTIWTINQNREATKRNKTVWTMLVMLMYTSSTVHCAIDWNQLAKAFVDNENPGQGPGVAFSLAHVPPANELAASSFLILNIFTADCLFIWRCWMVWQRRWIFVLVPICSTISGIALGAFALHTQNVLLTSNIPVNVTQTESRNFVNFSNAFFSLSIATSLTTTFLIMLRIVLVQRAFKKAGLQLTSYSALIEILVETAAMYSVTLLLFVILESIKNEALYYPQNIHAQVAGLAPTLIILRVAAGLSRPESHWSGHTSVDLSETRLGNASSIRFGSSNMQSEA